VTRIETGEKTRIINVWAGTCEVIKPKSLKYDYVMKQETIWNRYNYNDPYNPTIWKNDKGIKLESGKDTLWLTPFELYSEEHMKREMSKLFEKIDEESERMKLFENE
jgi:hypothetical protein